MTAEPGDVIKQDWTIPKPMENTTDQIVTAALGYVSRDHKVEDFWTPPMYLKNSGILHTYFMDGHSQEQKEFSDSIEDKLIYILITQYSCANLY
jgi:hypothetical protein